MNKKNTGVQENPEPEDLPGDGSDLTGEQGLQSPTEIFERGYRLRWGENLHLNL
jgi:hypothetical protein